MKRIKFVLPSNKYLQVYLPDFSLKNNTKSSIILKLLTVVNLSLIFIFLATVSLGRFFYSNADVTNESSVFTYSIIILNIILILYLAKVVLGGTKKLIDPPLFLGVLIYALLATSAAVFTTQANVANTFGINEFRGMGGLAVMIEVALFYLLNVYITNLTLFKRSLKFFTGGALLLIIILALTTSTESNLLATNFAEIAIGLIFLSTMIVFLFKRSFRLFNFSVMVLLVVGLFLLINLNSTFYTNIFLVLISSFFASTLVFILLFVSKAEWVNEKINDLKSSFKMLISQKALSSFFVEVLNLLVLLAPLIIFLIIALLLINKSVSFDVIGTKIAEIRNAANSVFIFSNIQRALLGLGGSSYSVTKSFVSNIILVQGLLGLLSYLFIWIYGIVRSFALLRKMKSVDGTFKLGVLLMFVLVFVPVYSFFALTPFSLIIIWWISLACIGILTSFVNNKSKELYSENDWQVKGIKIRNFDLLEWGFYLKYFIVILLLVGGGYLLYNLVKIIGV